MMVRAAQRYLSRTRRSVDTSPLDDLDEVGAPRCTVIIASTARSGSNLLAFGLGDTGRFGVPSEYLNMMRMARSAHLVGVPVVSTVGVAKMWARRLTLRRGWDATYLFDASTMRPYIDSLVARRTTPNGVFSLKVHWRDWAEVQRRYALDETWFPQPVRWVHITRRDTVAQAVSRVRADQTGRWVAHAPERLDDVAVYDRAAIHAAYREAREAHAAWQAFFARCGIQPVEVAYEDLVADYEGTIVGVAAELGERVDHVSPPRLRRQADEVNLDWIRRFRVDAPDLGLDLGGDVDPDPDGDRDLDRELDPDGDR